MALGSAHRFLPALVGILFAWGMPGSLFSQERVFENSGSKATLIELYSSEGCSSCPPAEAWIGKLKSSPDLWKGLFPAVFHVDYWDNLGWPDRFARPVYTQRQRSHAARLGQDSVYTPEFVVNGAEWRGWFSGGAIPLAPTYGTLTLSVAEGGKTVSASLSAVPSQSYTINVALLGFGIVTDVKRGENGGRQLEHNFVVLDFVSKPMALQSGAMALHPIDAPGAVVAWVTTTEGALVQAAGGWLE